MYCLSQYINKYISTKSVFLRVKVTELYLDVMYYISLKCMTFRFFSCHSRVSENDGECPIKSI